MSRLIGLFIFTVLLAAPANAAVVVSPPRISEPALEVNASGRTVIAWNRTVGRREFVEARLGARSSKLARAVRIAEGSVADLALGADGTAALAIGTDDRRLLIAIARPGHGFGRPRALAPYAGAIQLAVQPDGTVVAIRSVGVPGPTPDVPPHAELQLSLARPGSRFEPFRAFDEGRPIAGASLAIDPRDGAALLFYGNGHQEPFTEYRLAVASLALGADAFGPSQVLATQAEGTAILPQATAGPGGVGVVYRHLDTVWLARRAADGAWPAAQPVVVVPQPPEEPRYPYEPTVALPAGGGALAAWTLKSGVYKDVEENQRYQAVAAVGQPTGGFEAPEELTRFVRAVSLSRTVAAAGEAFLVTAVSDGPVVLSTRAAGATTLTRRTLSATGDGVALLSAGGRHVLAAFVRDGRLRLTVVR